MELEAVVGACPAAVPVLSYSSPFDCLPEFGMLSLGFT